MQGYREPSMRTTVSARKLGDGWLEDVAVTVSWLAAYAAFLFAMVLPAVLVLIRETVKHRRQEMIQDLAAVFDTSAASGGKKLIPSFEFVKFRYFLDSQSRQPQDFRTRDWVLSIVPFFAIVGSVCWFCFWVIFWGRLPSVLNHLHETACAAGSTPPCVEVPIWAYGMSSAFLGSYLIEIRQLYRAINNFDLSPAIVVESTINIAGGVGVAVLIVSAVNLLDILGGAPDSSLHSAVIILCFAAGVLPQAAIRWLMTKSRLANFKRENPEIFKLFEATPIELIDGIDTETRDRLGNYHLSSTQNLAAANPLMLFVETPYGVYQIMDWVAQAQLCASTGPKAIAALWKLGVRTLFDLERAAFDDVCFNKPMLEAIGTALMIDVPPRAGAEAVHYDAAFVTANIGMRLNDPHVHRLRQIYMQVGDTIGREHFRFLVRDGSNSRAVISSNIRFTGPDTAQIWGGGFGIFSEGSRVKILGGQNDGKVCIVVSASPDALKLSGDELVAASCEPEIIVLRISP